MDLSYLGTLPAESSPIESKNGTDKTQTNTQLPQWFTLSRVESSTKLKVSRLLTNNATLYLVTNELQLWKPNYSILEGQKKFKLRPSELEHSTMAEHQPMALTNRMSNRLEEQYHESRKLKMKKQHRNSRQYLLRILSQPSQSTRTEMLETPPMHLQSTETLQYQTS